MEGLAALAEPTDLADLATSTLIRAIGITFTRFKSPATTHALIEFIRFRVQQRGASEEFDKVALAERQPYECLQKLADVAPLVETQIENLCRIDESRTELEDTKQQVRRLLAGLEKPLLRVVVQPAIDYSRAKPLLTAVAGSLTSYVEADDNDVVDRNREIVATIRRAVAFFDELSCDYGSRYLIPFLNSLELVCQRHYEGHPFSRPGRVDQVECLRRLPLWTVGQELSIPLRLVNSGDGPAMDLGVRVLDASGLIVADDVVRLGSLEPGSMKVDLPATVAQTDSVRSLLLEVAWTNADSSVATFEEIIDIPAQRQDIRWGELDASDPYSLDPVSMPSELVGRAETVSQIIATLSTPSVGSLYIHGQKRVGKTSIARAVKNLLEQKDDVLVVFRDIGSVTHPDPVLSIDQLVRRLSDDLVEKIPFTVPSATVVPNGSLSPLIEFLERAVKSLGGRHVVLILDEFDTMPLPLFQRTPERDAFFMGLRSISSMEGVGLVLVGGERMRLITTSGVEINKFKSFTVDSLEWSSHRQDFIDLVRQPVAGSVEFDDSALELIYAYSAGNPYFAKQICGIALREALSRRDAFISANEVERGLSIAMTTFGPQTFAHYWEDYLLERGDEADRRTLRRRRVLLALADCVRSHEAASDERIAVAGRRWGLTLEDCRAELDEFRTRSVLKKELDEWRCSVGLFQRWLAERGHVEIALPVSELEAEARSEAELARQRVSLDEAEALAGRWPSYKGRVTAGTDIQTYLRQFGDERAQRLIFRILERVSFFSEADERKMLRESFDAVVATMRERSPSGVWKRNQILVTSLGGAGKSGQILAKEYADENSLPGQVVQLADLASEVAKRIDVTDVIIVDDFAGSGLSATSELSVALGAGEFDLPRPVRLHLVFLVALSESLDSLRTMVSSSGLEAQVRAIHQFGSEGRCFSEESGVFPDVLEREEARLLVRGFGERLESRAPLGFSDCEALVVFSRTVPNNTLPILWKNSKSFAALFPRHGSR